MHRKYFSYLAFFGLLLIAAIFVFTNRKSTIRGSQMNFALDQPSRVDKIIIQDNENRILLEKEKNSWRLNRHSIAKREIVEMFLQALGRIEVRSPASKSIRDSITSKLEQQGTHLILYQGNRVLKSLDVYYEKDSVPGTYMMDHRIRKPFRVGLTGYKGDNIQDLFSLDVAGWMDNVLVDIAPGDIALIQVEYPRHPEQTFSITLNEKSTPEFRSAEAITSSDSINQEKIRDYLLFFGTIRYTGIAGQSDLLLRSPGPFAIITIIDKKGRKFQLDAYRKLLQGENEYDMNSYIAVSNVDSLPVLVNYTETDLIMKIFSDFLKK
jgi:hypothetical protein